MNNMKDFEIYSNLKVSKINPVIIRLDGRNFHTLSSDLKFEKPYDVHFAKAMSDVCLDIANEFQPLFIYSFSDEINILLNELPFNGRVEKLDSVFASFASSSLTSKLIREFNIDNDKLFNENPSFNDEYERFKRSLGIQNSEDTNEVLGFRKPISFDSRIVPISHEEIPEYFKWRQNESWRNCINGYGIWSLKRNYPADVAASKLFGLSLSDIIDILSDEGIDFNEIDLWKKRGFAVYKNFHTIKKYDKLTDSEVVERRRYLYRDFNLPKFDRQFFVKKEIIEENP
ncbi:MULTISPECIES: tRNA(His) guanylyltransferase Thg1 family protein [Methanobrevibacter]|jgi:tRNA(His) guanylyltransferase|uniref:tRNA(His) guanylyltransferase Thg1 family protein n=1 Tax=Methanobrevibacter TaxID=2172 RepID=UPI00069D9590|nr:MULTISPECIES: tRNA(His) guanylyltransferase Thg1 family protein [Methanobrevibacter]MCI6775059.1 guanylyltransferase [Methanobrevibacter boviskoreani]MCI6931021.1 guanylyltransferase [Methanobrevibacter boviskoreani]MDD6256559.1 tRNA(His) guanylyltransferase Thg1 family protein [Methanobrevibacter boviskoreani]MDY5614491.1 tRNA(His) guanylyltransferase Thg1 family protein [Methanobrevibacter boviskoreani]